MFNWTFNNFCILPLLIQFNVFAFAGSFFLDFFLCTRKFILLL